MESNTRSESGGQQAKDSSEAGRAISARVHTVGCSGLRTVTIRGFRLSSGDGADVAGFDLGPSPEEHLLGAVGSSLAQTVAHVACAQDLSIDRIDIEVTGLLEPDQEMAHIAGRIKRIDGAITVTSEDAPGSYSRLADDVLRCSPLAAVIAVPLHIAVIVDPVEPESGVGDWQI